MKICQTWVSVVCPAIPLLLQSLNRVAGNMKNNWKWINIFGERALNWAWSSGEQHTVELFIKITN